MNKYHIRRVIQGFVDGNKSNVVVGVEVAEVVLDTVKQRLHS